jgi:RNA-directed DNA polymerase
MTAGKLTGAPSTRDLANAWKSIDWAKAEKRVYRLQMRIAKAVKEARWGKVRALQRLLTTSYEAKLLAIKRVTESQGSRTAGIDGEVWRSPSRKYQAITQLTRHGYQPQPLRRIYIPKRRGRRPLNIPTMRDRAMQALYLLALEPIAETTGDPHSYGFRRQRCTQDAIAQCYHTLATTRSSQWILKADIQSCFDELSHQWLLAHIPIDKTILRKWLKAGYKEKRTLFPTKSGAAQGGVISPALMNMALDGLQQALKVACHRRDKVNFIRYADDIVVTGATPEILQQTVRPVMEHFLAQRGLRLSPTKTDLFHIEEGFDFLGVTVRKYRGKFLTKPSKENVKAFLRDVRGCFKRGKGHSATALIGTLNPKIKGWANYYRGCAAKSTYSKVDDVIYHTSMIWVRRQFSNRRRYQAVRRYYRQVGARRWIFSTPITKKDGKTYILCLAKMMDVSIARHIKVRMNANQFDPAYHYYYQKRQRWKSAISRRQQIVDRKRGVTTRSALPLGSVTNL